MDRYIKTPVGGLIFWISNISIKFHFCYYFLYFEIYGSFNRCAINKYIMYNTSFCGCLDMWDY